MPADTTTHPAFARRQPRDDSVKVWRYMDLLKFIVLLQSSSLHLARADTLGNLEGMFSSVEEKSEDGQRRSDDDILDHVRKMSRHFIYASCWYSGDVENALMWRAYGTSDGVVVQSTYAKLRDSIDQRSAEMPPVHIVPIRYHGYKGGSDISCLDLTERFTYKRHEFTSEKEIRVICQWNGQEETLLRELSQFVKVDLASLVESIRMHPGAPSWKRRAVYSLIRGYGLNCDVMASSLDEI